MEVIEGCMCRTRARTLSIHDALLEESTVATGGRKHRVLVCERHEEVEVAVVSEIWLWGKKWMGHPRHVFVNFTSL